MVVADLIATLKKLPSDALLVPLGTPVMADATLVGDQKKVVITWDYMRNVYTVSLLTLDYDVEAIHGQAGK